MLSAALASALLVSGALAAAPARAASALSSRSSSSSAQALLIAGAGDGHGVGMSQDGAYGYARHGLSYTAILAHYYTGTALGQASPGATVRVLIGSTVRRIPLERYVRGVVAAEMPAQWPSAALQAQAIASRTYALTAHAGGSRFDVYADTRSQVYRGAAAETAQTNAAVAATAGQIVTYAGRPAITYFFADSGGLTEDVQNAWPGSEAQPWLRGVPDPYDTSASARWQLSLSFHAAAARLHGLVKGRFGGIVVLRRGYSPRILSAAILGSAGQTQVSGAELAARLGLPDTWAYFAVRTGTAAARPEPDRSGWSPSVAAPAPPVQAAASSAAVQGGAQAPGAAPAAVAGGTIAGR